MYSLARKTQIQGADGRYDRGDQQRHDQALQHPKEQLAWVLEVHHISPRPLDERSQEL